MKNIFIIAIVLIQISLLNASYSFAQNFAPLNIGNVWVWEHVQWGTIEKSTVVDTNCFIIDRTYSKVLLYDSSDTYIYNRYNNVDSFYYKYNPTDTLNNYEIPFYKLNCALGDTFSFILAIVQQDTNIFPVYKTFEVIDVFSAPVFDTILTIKVLHWSAGGLVEGVQLWTDELGMLFSETGEGGGVDFLLRGCVINGRLYGDTSTTVNVEDEYNYEFDFKLYQNYPNPFNPITTISFQIKERGLIQVNVYDILGNKLKTLVNEERDQGTYFIKFDGTNLPSGVYIYSLSLNGFAENKKMILLK